MGRILVKMLQPSGAKVTICSRNPRRARTLCNRLGVTVGAEDSVQDADMVVVSVPIEKTVSTCKRLLKIMKPHSLLIDVASVKKGIVDKVVTSVPKDVEYLSIHPLFGPDTEEFKGENVLAINPRGGPLSKSILKLLSNNGLKMTHVTADEHDRKTAVTQALHHFAYASLAACMSKLIKRNDLQRFSTKSLRKTIEIIQSLSDNIDTVLEIQERNQYAVNSRRTFAATASALSRLGNGTNRRIKSDLRSFRA
jgi:prephenate dehydrogenase